MIGEVPMRMAMIEIKRVLEALAIRLTRKTRTAKAPLADSGRAVPRVTEQHGDGTILFTKRELAVAPDPYVDVCCPVISAARDGATRCSPSSSS